MNCCASLSNFCKATFNVCRGRWQRYRRKACQEWLQELLRRVESPSFWRPWPPRILPGEAASYFHGAKPTWWVFSLAVSLIFYLSGPITIGDTISVIVGGKTFSHSVISVDPRVAAHPREYIRRTSNTARQGVGHAGGLLIWSRQASITITVLGLVVCCRVAAVLLDWSGD